MSWNPGLITRIEGDRMDVKVPTAEDCPACPVKSVCTFEGPASAYRTLHVASRDGYRVGDRVEVEEPISVLGVTFVALVLVPVILLSIGHWLTTRFADTLEMASFLGHQCRDLAGSRLPCEPLDDSFPAICDSDPADCQITEFATGRSPS